MLQSWLLLYVIIIIILLYMADITKLFFELGLSTLAQTDYERNMETIVLEAYS